MQGSANMHSLRIITVTVACAALFAQAGVSEERVVRPVGWNFVTLGGEASSQAPAPAYPHPGCQGGYSPFCGAGGGYPVCYPEGIYTGVHCDGHCRREPHWHHEAPIPFETLAQGEYVGPSRTEHVFRYRLRVDDELALIYRLTREETSEPYELNVGDEIRVESLTDKNLDRDLSIQPDGDITVRLLGQVRAARLTIPQLTESLEEQYKKYYKTPSISVTPLKVNTRLEDLRATVDGRQGVGGQQLTTRISPDGTVQLPALGSVPAQGLTLDELKEEIDARYAATIQGIEVTPVLTARAPRYVFVLGEVRVPGRYELTGPTTAMQAIALGGGWNNGGNVRHMVIFRRDDNWRLMATRLDLQGALFGKRPCPADELWVRDSDIVLVPKSDLLRSADFINLVFTRGFYGVLPMNGVGVGLSSLSI